MARCARSAVLVLWSLLFATSTIAQSNDPYSGTASCGGNINASREWYEIRFKSYCDTKLFDNNTAPPIKKATFQDCSIACVDQGITCGGFAYDRSSHYSEDNCYLNRATNAWYEIGTDEENEWFDSAAVDNSSIPMTTRNCPTIGQNGVYRGYNLRCGEGIQDDSIGAQNHLDTVFAASLSDCIDHCYKIQSDSGEFLCQAVTWEASELHGYENCILKGAGYVEPSTDASWDSATLAGTEGRAVASNGTSTSSPTPAPSSSDSQQSSSAQGSRGLSGGAKAGIAIGVIAAVALVGALIIFLVRRHIKKSVRVHGEPPQSEVTSLNTSMNTTVNSSMNTTVNSSPPVIGTLPHEEFATKTATGKEREVDVDATPPPSELATVGIAELAHSTSTIGKARASTIGRHRYA